MRRFLAVSHSGFYEWMGRAPSQRSQDDSRLTRLIRKYPRQATFMKQANIAHGPQQVNSAGTQSGITQGGAQPNPRPSRTGKKLESQQNKLLEAQHGQPGSRMDTSAAQTAERSNQPVKIMGTVHRAKKPRV